MSELKKSESAIDQAWERYDKLRESIRLYQTQDNCVVLEEQHSSLPYIPPRLPPVVDENEAAAATMTDNETTETDAVTLEHIVDEISTLQGILGDELQPQAKRFMQRLLEKDAVTDKPRYGANAQKRVNFVLATYHGLADALHVKIIDEEDTEGETTPGKEGVEGGGITVVQSLKQQYTTLQETQQEKERRDLEIKQRQQKAEQERLELQQKKERERLERQRQQELEAQRQAQELLHQQAERARQERLQREAAEQSWISSVTVSKKGIQEQVQAIKEATKDDKLAQDIALQALYQLFSQIQSHPENVQFRRIRCDHEKFQQDIGRHTGGREVLIAAGFSLGAIDEVPCFISREPDIERDMDGWSAWFDLQKAAYDVLKEEHERIEQAKKVTRRK